MYSLNMRRAATASLVAIALVAIGIPGASARTRPNVLVIVTDDQAVETLLVMPQTRDWLVRQGITFTNAYATTPQCCPSRSSIMTGRYAHNHRVLTNYAAADLDMSTTVQHHLHGTGYRTAFFGKYLNSWDVAVNPPYFDDWATFTRSRHGYIGGPWNVNGEVQTVQDYGTRFIANQAADFMWSTARQRKPWLMFISPAAPHSPFVPEPRYINAAVPQWEGDPAVFEHDAALDPTEKEDKPRFIQRSQVTLEDAQERRERQLRTLLSVDDLVGRLRRILFATEQLDNTLVVFLSDNGYMWGQHGRMMKSLPYAPATRIPMFMSWPGHLQAGATDTRLAATIDVTPTILDAVGLPNSGLDGRSLFDRGARSRLLLEYWQGPDHARIPTWASTVSTDFQYTEYYASTGEIVFNEYYDTRRDPYQLRNLMASSDSVIDSSSLSSQLAADRSCSGSSCP